MRKFIYNQNTDGGNGGGDDKQKPQTDAKPETEVDTTVKKDGEEGDKEPPADLQEGKKEEEGTTV